MAHPVETPKVFSEAEMQAKVDEAVKAAKNGAITFSEEKLKAMVDATVADIQKRVTEKVASLEKTVTDRELEHQRAGYQMFCERLIREGKQPASILDKSTGKPNKVDELVMLAASPQAITFFSEGKEVKQTAVQVAMANMESMPVIYRFNEKVKDGTKKGPDGKEIPAEEVTEEEKDQIRHGFQSFSEHLPGKHDETGKLWSADYFINGFAAAKKRDPKITPQKFMPELLPA